MGINFWNYFHPKMNFSSTKDLGISLYLLLSQVATCFSYYAILHWKSNMNITNDKKVCNQRKVVKSERSSVSISKRRSNRRTREQQQKQRHSYKRPVTRDISPLREEQLKNVRNPAFIKNSTQQSYNATDTHSHITRSQWWGTNEKRFQQCEIP
jgi:hypothetical protein